LPEGWDLIPGARGCTPQACAFRDHYQELATFEAELFGLSTQTTDYQRETAERFHLPFEILSDAALTFANALKLPTFEAGGMRLIKRLTLIIRGSRIETVSYPVFRRPFQFWRHHARLGNLRREGDVTHADYVVYVWRKGPDGRISYYDLDK
jgi:peroxiredoxin